MVCGHEQGQPARPHWQKHCTKGHRRRSKRPSSLRARAVGQHLQPVDEQHSRLVYFSSTVVGSPNSGLVRRTRQRVCGAQRSRCSSAGWRWQGVASRPRCAGHLVFVCSGPLLNHGMATSCCTKRFSRSRPSRVCQWGQRLRPLPAQQRAGHRLRHHLLLGGSHDHDDHPLHRSSAFPRCVHPRFGARFARQKNEQVRRQRARPGRPHRRHRFDCLA